MEDIVIGEPVGGSFTVTIYDSGSSIVYGPAAQTNAPFNPGALPAGDYTMKVEYGTEEVTVCFTVSPCECPTLVFAGIILGSPPLFYGYAYFYFDFSGGFDCPFLIAGNIHTDVGAPTPFSFYIDSLTDLTDAGGGTYFKQIWVGGFATFVDYTISIPITVTGGAPITCYEGTIAPDCTSPNFIAFGGTGLYFQMLVNLSPLAWAIGMISTGCSGASCNIATINYLQVNAGIVGTPDSGTVTGHSLCPNGITFIPVSPNTSYPGYSVDTNFPKYSVTMTDCCGVTRSSITTLIGGAIP